MVPALKTSTYGHLGVNFSSLKETPRSPLGDSHSLRLNILPQTRIIHELSRYFQSPCPPESVDCDYELFRCAETGLEFCSPALPGNKIFYSWISSFPNYYPKFRWEYGRVLARIRELGGAFLPLCDVGCGDGQFLSAASSTGSRDVFGLDFNKFAIEKCVSKGIPSFCGSIQEALDDNIVKRNHFPFVSSFHCLEHVEDPVAFVQELAQIMAPGGRIFLSTPASPMSFETAWFDIMNHPPHHMTRWNLASYQKMAAILNFKLRYYFPKTFSVRQAIRAWKLKNGGPFGNAPFSFLKSRDFLMLWKKLYLRSKNHPLHGADTILVELSR